VPAAINVGDYLVGLGYRLVSRERSALGGDCAADILNRLSEAHLKLSEGQGAELLWRDARDQTLTALDALRVYALKTAPAFEAALYCGLRAAGPTDAYDKMVQEFSKALGVAFQILNDLKDWETDAENKVVAGQDVLSARPTLLLALAIESLAVEDRSELLCLLRDETPALGDPGAPGYQRSPTIDKVRSLFERADVFAKAQRLVEKYRAKAEAVADDVEPVELRELLYYLVDTVLDPMPGEPAEKAEANMPALIQITPPQPAVS
jgi:geranylgeranyl pyrophosphate synthase